MADRKPDTCVSVARAHWLNKDCDKWWETTSADITQREVPELNKKLSKLRTVPAKQNYLTKLRQEDDESGHDSRIYMAYAYQNPDTLHPDLNESETRYANNDHLDPILKRLGQIVGPGANDEPILDKDTKEPIKLVDRQRGLFGAQWCRQWQDRAPTERFVGEPGPGGEVLDYEVAAPIKHSDKNGNDDRNSGWAGLARQQRQAKKAWDKRAKLQPGTVEPIEPSKVEPIEPTEPSKVEPSKVEPSKVEPSNVDRKGKWKWKRFVGRMKAKFGKGASRKEANEEVTKGQNGTADGCETEEKARDRFDSKQTSQEAEREAARE